MEGTQGRGGERRAGRTAVDAKEESDNKQEGGGALAEAFWI